MRKFSGFVAIIGLFSSLPAQAFEMLGFVGYTGSIYGSKPANYVSSGGGAGYGFMGRLNLGAGAIESGFWYSLTSITTSRSFGNVKSSGSYWIIPLLYRVPVLPPFISIAFGPDYAILGSNHFSVDNTTNDLASSGFKSHFGFELSAEATQDVGENLSVVLDLRYRYPLADAITLSDRGVSYHTYLVALGLQKRLE